MSALRVTFLKCDNPSCDSTSRGMFTGGGFASAREARANLPRWVRFSGKDFCNRVCLDLYLEARDRESSDRGAE